MLDILIITVCLFTVYIPPRYSWLRAKVYPILFIFNSKRYGAMKIKCPTLCYPIRKFAPGSCVTMIAAKGTKIDGTKIKGTKCSTTFLRVR